jgi:hypothetical protein
MVYNMSKVGWRPYRHLVLGFGFWVLGFGFGLGCWGERSSSSFFLSIYTTNRR